MLAMTNTCIGLKENVLKQRTTESRQQVTGSSETAIVHQAPGLPRLGTAKRVDLLGDLRLRAFLAQASEVPVVPEETLLGPTTRCHVPVADDAGAPIAAHVAPANLAFFGPRHGVTELPEIRRCVEPIRLSLHAKDTILKADSDASPLLVRIPASSDASLDGPNTRPRHNIRQHHRQGQELTPPDGPFRWVSVVLDTVACQNIRIMHSVSDSEV